MHHLSAYSSRERRPKPLIIRAISIAFREAPFIEVDNRVQNNSCQALSKIDQSVHGVYDFHVANPTVFDKLVKGLSSNERQEMLEKIAGSVTVPQQLDEEERPSVDLEQAYGRMGLFRRLIVILTAVFTGRDKLSVVEEHLVRDIRRDVASRLPHGLDMAQDQLRPRAADDFRALSEAARVFTPFMGRVMGRERRAFIAFLAGLHAPATQSQLVDETNPFTVGANYPDMKDADVRRKAIAQSESIMATLQPAVRQAIYTDVRLLHQLLALSGFPFEKIIGVFYPAAGGDPVPAPLSRIADELSRLAGIFVGLRKSASAKLLEAFGLYQDNPVLEQGDEAIEAHVTQQIQALIAAFESIYRFRSRYPLADMVRLAHRDIHYKPSPVAGGEDWFAQWKSFWRKRIEGQHRRFSYQRRVEALSSDATASLELDAVEPFPGYPPSGFDAIARHALSLGLARAFFGELYRKRLASSISTLYRDGEFYKADNRSEFERIHEALERDQTDLANLEVRLQPTGDLGMSWKRTNDGSLPPEAAEERQVSVATGIDAEASALLHRIVEHLQGLGEILQGVLYGTVGGKYDTISNLGELSGTRNPGAFATHLETTHARIKSAAGLIADMHNAETFAAEASEKEER